jgi:hypothetical protein
VAEVRGWRGAAIALAAVTTTKALSVVDLTAKTDVSSPFFDDEIAWRVEVRSLLVRVAEELSRPLIRGEEIKLYGVSQLFADMVKKAGWNGIKYPSAQGEGYNVVLFDPSVISVSDPEYIRVLNVTFDLQVLRDGEPPYEQLPFDL